MAQFLQLLEASAARRRHLDGQLADAEAAVAALDDELRTAEDHLANARADEDAAWARLQATANALARVQAQLEGPLLPWGAPDAGDRTKPAAVRCAAAVMRPPLSASALAPAGPALAPVIAACSRPGASGGASSAPPRTTRTARAVAGALARREELSAELGRRHEQWQAATVATASAGQEVEAKTQALEAPRAALASLRQQLSAALQDPLAMGQTQALNAAVGPSPLAEADIPPSYLDLYRQAASTCAGLSWTVLAAIGKIESDHGRSAAPGVHSGANFAGAMGPMQFLGATWAAYGVDANADGIPSPYQPPDAIFGAARYLCANGAGDPAHLPDAIWAYNHAQWYVDEVLVLALSYGAGGLEPASVPADVTALVANPNLTLSPAAAADLLGGRADARVVRVLAAIAAHHRISVSVIETGHSAFVHGTDRVSNHFYGRAVDISAVDGDPVTATNDAALDLAIAILTGDPSLRPDEFGSPWPQLSRFAGAFSDADHQNHLHIGWRA